MGTTYLIGEEDISITYNYAWIFYKLHKKGLKAISGKTGKQALKILFMFEEKLLGGPFGSACKQKKQEDYWTCSPNNCYHNAVLPLIELAKKHPNKKFFAQ